MSFILDALRKSETDRQREQGPEFATLPHTTAAKRRPGWVYALVGLLIANALGLGFFLLRPESNDPPTRKRVASAQPNQPPEVARPEPRRIMPSEPPASVATGVSRTQSPQKPVTVTAKPTPQRKPPHAADNPPTVRPLAAETSRAAATRPPEAKPSARPAVVPEKPPPEVILPTFVELKAKGELSLPDLHLDLHVFSAKAAARFVFINDRKYREGDRLQEDPVVQEISGEGVVLHHQGQSFLLRKN